MTDTKLVLDPDLLKPSDLDRAEVALVDVLAGRDPETLIDLTTTKFREWFTFMVWCFRSRTNPGFTWADARDVEFGAVQLPQGTTPPPPPPTAEPERNGSGPGSGPGSGSTSPRKRSRASATSSGSPAAITSG